MVRPATPGSQSSLHESNRRRVLRAVRAAGSLTQAEIARTTGLSPATVSNIIRELRAAGVVVVAPTSAGGRRAQAVSLAGGSGLAVAVDFGHSHLRVVVGNLAYEVLAEDRIPLDVDDSAAHDLDEAERLIDELLAEVRATRADVLGLGLGVPGPISEETGAVGSSTILPGWIGVRPEAEMKERLGLPVRVDNDANLGALAEVTWGAARGCTEAAYIKVATGVGAGLLLGGQLYRGAGGTAGEIGHITVDERGRVCRCGNRGCLETFAGGPFIVELLQPPHGRSGEVSRTVRDVVDDALGGDAGAQRVIADAGRYIGIGAASLCNLMNPQRVVVGGELSRAGDLLLDEVRESVRRYAVPSAAQLLEVVPGVLGERAEVLGALALVLRELDRTGATLNEAP